MAQNLLFTQGQQGGNNTNQGQELPVSQGVNTPGSVNQAPLSQQMPPSPPPASVPPISQGPQVTPPPLPPSPPPPPMSRISLPQFQLPVWIKVFIGLFALLFVLIILGAVFQSHNVFSQKVTLQYWGLWENTDTMNQILADFTRQYPNITVNYTEEDPNQYTDRLLTRVQNGNGPDIFTYHNSWVPELQPILAPLSTSAITTSEFTSFFYPVAQEDLMRNGAIYGIPLEVDTLSLFVNNTILKAAGVQIPTTWDQFTNVASLTTVKDDNQKIKTAGAALGAYDNIVHASDILAMLFLQNGAKLNDIASTSKNATDALNFYDSFVTNSNNVWDTSLPPSLVDFAQGNLAMYFGYSYDIFNIKAISSTLDFSVYPIPHLPNRPITIASYWVQGVSIKSQHQKEAMLLMHFLAQKDTEEKLFSIESKTRAFGEPYARKDIADTLKNDPLVYPFVSQATTAQSTYFSSNTYDSGINAQMNGYIGNAIRAAISSSSADSAVDTLAQGVAQILQQYGQAPKSNP